jgi:hypothetical protein
VETSVVVVVLLSLVSPPSETPFFVVDQLSHAAALLLFFPCVPPPLLLLLSSTPLIMSAPAGSGDHLVLRGQLEGHNGWIVSRQCHHCAGRGVCRTAGASMPQQQPTAATKKEQRIQLACIASCLRGFGCGHCSRSCADPSSVFVPLCCFFLFLFCVQTSIATTMQAPDMLLTSSRDKSIIMWNLTREEGKYGVAQKRLTGHSHYVQDIAISSDAQFALSGSWDSTLRLWDLNTGVTTRRFIGHSKDVLSVAFSADNRLVTNQMPTSEQWGAGAVCLPSQDGTRF